MGKLKNMVIDANTTAILNQDPFFEEPSDTDYDEQENLTGLAIVKAHAFAQDYNPISGRAEDRQGYHLLKEGYTAGFLAGFTYKFTGDTEL